MSDTVVSLKGAVRSDQKQAWLDLVAQSYDNFVRKHGHEPTAMFYVALSGKAWKTAWELKPPWQTNAARTAAILAAAEMLRKNAFDDYAVTFDDAG